MRYLGLDIQAATIAVAIAEGRGEVRSLGKIPHRPEAVHKLQKKLGDPRTLHVCYEAEHEALRDLVRAREAAKTDELRARHRLAKYLLRYGKHPPTGCRTRTLTWWRWLRTLKFEHALQTTTVLDYTNELEHQTACVERLEKNIDDAIENAPKDMKAIVAALQSLRGVAKITRSPSFFPCGRRVRRTDSCDRRSRIVWRAVRTKKLLPSVLVACRHESWAPP